MASFSVTLSPNSEKSESGQIHNAQLFGEIAWLYTQSPLHKDWAVKSLEQWILPAILTRQCRLYKRDGKPIAYVSWAYLSEEAEKRYVRASRDLHPKDWKSGERGWLIDVIAPFGDAKEVTRDLRNNVFVNDVGRALRLSNNKPDEMRIIYMHGARAVGKARDRNLNPTVELSN